MHPKTLFFLSAVLFVPVTALGALPTREGRVTDQSKILTAEERNQLDQRLADFERETSRELEIVLVPRLEGQTIETLAEKLLHDWKIGSRWRGDGILMVAAIEDRKVRIQVGWGLGVILPDSVCSAVLQRDLLPAFRRGHYAEGLVLATNSLMEHLKGPARPGDFWSWNHFLQGVKWAASELGALAIGVLLVLGLVRFFGFFGRGRDGTSSADGSGPGGGGPGGGGGGGGGSGGASGSW